MNSKSLDTRPVLAQVGVEPGNEIASLLRLLSKNKTSAIPKCPVFATNAKKISSSVN